MRRGQVMGEVWSTRKCEALSPYRLKLVALCDAAGGRTGQVVVAVDTLDAGRGDPVLVSFGSGARNVVRPGSWDNKDLLCDAAINQIVDGQEE